MGYGSCQKSFIGRRPKSTYAITPDGRQALVHYLDALQRVIDAVANKKGESD